MKYRGFVFKKGFIWIAWILCINNDSVYYYDNEPMKPIYTEGIKFLAFAFTKKRAYKKLEKKFEKKEKFF